MDDTFDIYVVYEPDYHTNKEKPSIYCVSEFTARRLSLGKGFDGSNARYEKKCAFVVDEEIYAPVSVLDPSKEDLEKEEAAETKRKLAEKIKSLKLSDEEKILLFELTRSDLG